MGFCVPPSAIGGAQEGRDVSIPNTPATTEATQSNNQAIRPFEPLTSVPGLREVGQSNTFAGLLNNLYLICIGAGAALAVLQIVRGGLTYMLSDSITNKKEAREVITGAVVGLLLVLSPAIVFGIIDPRILNLNVDFERLAPEDAGPATGGGAGAGPTTGGGAGGPGNAQDTQSGSQDRDSDGGASDEDESAGPVGGSVPLRICAATGTYVGASYSRVRQFCTSGMASEPVCEGKPTITDARAFECNQNYPITGDDCLASLVECTQINASLQATSRSSCRAQFPSGAGSTMLWNCPQMSSNVALDASVPGPLCAGSQGYALNSNNLDCPF